MKALLGDEYPAYLASFERPCFQGIRVNTTKLSPEEFCARRGRAFEPVPWCPTGFYLPDDRKELSKHPDYYAGLYYLQEPSAMTPASILPVMQGEHVLDLCAAPGGKATELGSRIGEGGMLLANDISNSRAKALFASVSARNAGT